MNRLDDFRRLAARAAHDGPGRIDVSRQVLARLPALRPQLVDRTLLACALGSLAAAGLVAMLAASAWQEGADAWPQLLESLDLALR